MSKARGRRGWHSITGVKKHYCRVPTDPGKPGKPGKYGIFGKTQGKPGNTP